MWSEKDKRESKITPRLRAEDTGLTVTLPGRDEIRRYCQFLRDGESFQ